MLEIAEALAQGVIRVLEMLRNVTDGLLRRGGPVIVSGRRDGVEGRNQPTAEDVGVPLELEYDGVGRLASGRRLCRECRGEQACDDEQGATAHAVSGSLGSAGEVASALRWSVARAQRRRLRSTSCAVQR